MAETPIEVVIRARDESQAVLNKAIEQMKKLEASTKRAGEAGKDLTGLRGALERISPQAAQAAAALEGMGVASAGLIVAAGAVVALGAALAALAAGAVSAAKNLADTVEKLDNLAAATGASVADIQVLSELFERQGISATVARTALNRLNIAIGEGNPLLKELGITARDPIQALLQLSDAMATSTDAGARAKVSQQLLGLSGKDLLVVIDTLRAAFPALAREMKESNQALGDDAIKTGRAFDESWERVTGRFEGFVNRIKVAAAEAGLAIINAFDKPTGPEQAIARQAAGIESQINKLNERIAALREKVAEPSQADQIISGSPARRALGGLPDAFVAERSDKIDELVKKVDALQQKLVLLRRTGREFGKDDLPLSFAAPLDESSDSADRLKDALAALDRSHEKSSDAVKKHAARVKELVDLFGLEKDAAEGAIKAAEGREREARKEALRINVFGGVSGTNQPAPFPETGPKAPVLPKLEVKLEGTNRVLAEWRDFVDEITSTAGALDSAMNALASGIQGGLGQVFAGLLSEGQTFARAMKTLFKSMVDAMLRELARLLAFKIIGLILGPGLPTKALADAAAIPFGQPALRSAGGIIRGPGTETSDNIPTLLSPGEFVVRAAAVKRPGVRAQLEAINGGVGRAIAGAGSSSHTNDLSSGIMARLATAATTPPEAWQRQEEARRGESAGNTFNIYGYDNHAILQQLLSPAGSLRKAQETLAIQGAY